jgi:hypothetical protein
VIFSELSAFQLWIVLFCVSDSADVRYESEHKKGQFEPAEVGKIAEKHLPSPS